MASLFSLLPGLREVRTPLLAGYLWIVAGWLALEPHIPARCASGSACSDTSNGLWHTIYRGLDTMGPVAPIVGLSFVAFLVGTVSRTLLGRRLEALVSPKVDEDAVAAVRRALEFWLRPGSAQPPDEFKLSDDVDLDKLAAVVVDERSLVANLGQQNLPQAIELQRLDEEVELRTGIAVPIVAVALATAERMDDWWSALAAAVGIAFAALLVIEARRISIKTRRTYVHLIAARQAHLPGLVAAAIRLDPELVRQKSSMPHMGPFG